MKPLTCDANLRNMVKRGPRSGSGREQRVFSDAGYWAIDYQYYLRMPQQVHAWRRTIARLRAGEQIIAPVIERSDTHSGRVLDAVAELKTGVALRDTEITILATGINVVEGLFIGINNRLYVITEITDGPDETQYFNPISSDGPWDDAIPWSDGTPAAQTWKISVLPPMRGDYPAGVAVKFTGITMVGVIDDPAQGDTKLDLIKRGNVSVTIIESI
jgi:hypothetical protein